jgi:LPS sulfotransferase NodH
MSKKDSTCQFVIITPGRSGSEHLSQTLANYADISMGGELFNQSIYGEGSFNHFITTHVGYKALGFLFNRQKLSRVKLNHPLKYLVRKFLQSRAPVSSAVSGFKLTLDQLAAYPFLLDNLIGTGTKIIYLYRQDRLAQVLSLIKARDSGNYHNRVGFSVGHSYSFDTVVVKEHYLDLMRWEQRLISRLEAGSFLSVSYERLFSSYNVVLSEIRSFLHLPPTPLPELSALQKLNPETLSSWVANLEEIEAVLSDLPWPYDGKN